MSESDNQARERLPAAPDPTPEELTPTPPGLTPDYDDAGVPSLEYVRDKIEGRYATALGTQELAETTEPVRKAEEQFAEREKKGKEKLEELRRSLGL